VARSTQQKINEMKNKGVREVIDFNGIPNDRRCIKCKWIFKVKINGYFGTRLVSCGYSQATGVGFDESFIPVINGVSFRILLISKLMWNIKAIIIDIETAYLHRSLDEDIYIDVPPSLDFKNSQNLILLEVFYGLIQSAREYYKKLIEVLKLIGFIGNK
jgi:hypothetical protein